MSNFPIPRRGQATPINNGATVSFTPRSGWSSSGTWVGKTDVMQALANVYSYAGFTVELSKNESPFATLTVRAPASDSTGSKNEQALDSWQILGSEEQKHILEHPLWMNTADLYAANMTTGCTWTLDRILKYNAQQFASQAEYPPSSTSGASADLIFAWSLFNGTGPTSFTSGIYTINLQQIYTAFQTLMIKGQEHYAVAKYILRHTQTIGDHFTSILQDLHPGCVYTTAQVISECSAGLVYPIPPRIKTKMQSIPAPQTVSGYTWGWRKLPSQETTTADYKVQITYDYVLDQWNTQILYNTL